MVDILIDEHTATRFSLALLPKVCVRGGSPLMLREGKKLTQRHTAGGLESCFKVVPYTHMG